MPLVIRVAHDFICPWCWIGLFQAKKLEKEFGATIQWLGYELYPDELEWPEPGSRAAEDLSGRPKVPSRLDLAYAAEGMARPTVARPKEMRTHNAHEAVEFAKTQGKGNEFLELLYRAYWERGLAINEPDVLARLAEGVLDDIRDLRKAVEERRFKDAIVGFDEPAYASGIWYVPTFIVGEERLAEQPYVVIRDAVLREREPAAR